MNKYGKQINPEDNELRKLRKSACLSQEKLAQKIGVSTSTIRRWESGQTEPTMTRKQMARFCVAVNKQFEKLPPKLAE